MVTSTRAKRRKTGAVSPETLRSEVEHGQRLPYYLLSGEEEFERDGTADWLVSKLKPDAAPDFNTDLIYGDALEVQRLLECYFAYPMLASHRLIVLRKCEKITADQCKQLDVIVSDPQGTSTLIAVGGKVDMRRRLYQQMGKLGLRVEFKTPYQNQVSQWLIRHTRNRSLKLEPEAASLLALYLGNNTRRLAGEIDKLSIYVGDGKPITAEAVVELAGVSSAASVFQLADAVGRQDFSTAQEMLHGMLGQGEEPLRVLPMLSRHLQLLLKAKDLEDQRLSGSEMARQIGVSPYFLKSYRHQARQFTSDQLWTGMVILLEADRLFKSRRRSQYQKILQLCLQRLCRLHS
jgi:DNA polymerase-3 subunit delta